MRPKRSLTTRGPFDLELTQRSIKNGGSLRVFVGMWDLVLGCKRTRAPRAFQLAPRENCNRESYRREEFLVVVLLFFYPVLRLISAQWQAGEE